MNRLLARLRPAERLEAPSRDASRHVRLVAVDQPPRSTCYVLTTAETAPCTCPDFCERDHDNE